MIKITLPLVPSLKHCYRNIAVNKRIKTKVATDWIVEAQYIAQREAKSQCWQYSEKEKLVMELTAYWADKKRRDMSNMHKLLPDALEKVLYDDDCYVCATRF